MPVTWDELREAVEAEDSSRLYWVADAALKRLEEVGDLFAPVLTLKQQLPTEFLRAVRTDGHTVKAHTTARKSQSARASEQGGRRLFTLNGRQLTLSVGDERFTYQLADKLPVRAKQSIGATLARKPLAGSGEEGTVEIIEGNLAKGYAYLFFSGSGLRGEFTFVRDNEYEWTITKGFVPWQVRSQK
jgi:hypothetical protein